jgi:alpha-beta hydrolase superfamily lysophospholipase
MDNHLWITAAVLVVAILLLAGCDTQNRMLYYPSSSVPSEQSLAGTGIRFWPSYGPDYRGFIGGNEKGRVRGTFIVFHGNGGTAANRGFYAEALGGFGYRVILAEYPKYGGRKGELGEAAFVKDGCETVRLAFESFGGPIFLLGESLGCGVVSGVVRAAPVPIDGVVLITPWDTLSSVANSHFPTFMVWLLLKDSYDNIGNLSSFKGRIAIVGAGRDKIIPIRHARNLYRSLASPATKMWVVEGAGHNDWPATVGPPWWKEVVTFVGGVEGQKP